MKKNAKNTKTMPRTHRTMRCCFFLSLIALFSVTPVMAHVVNFGSLERTVNARAVLSQYGIDLPSRPVVKGSSLLGHGLLEISETRCESLDIVFQPSAQVSSVTLEVVNRHLRSYLVSAFSSVDSEVLDEIRFIPTTGSLGSPGSHRSITRMMSHDLTSTDASKPIVKVTLTAPGASGVGCFDQAAISGLQFDGLRGPVAIETQFRSFPSELKTIPLHQWYNRSTNDNYITTAPNWRGHEDMTQKQGYVWVGIMGYAISPRYGSNVPGTKALHTWYSESRNDHRTTTDPRWVPAHARDTRRGGYVHLRLEGYVFDTDHALAGTWPLQMHYSSRRQDFDTTTRFPMLSATGDRNDSYINRGTQGYVIAAKPGDPQPSRDMASGIGKSLRDDGTVGVLQGHRNILFIGQNYTNVLLQNDRNYYAGLLTDNRDWNVRDYFSQISGGRYSVINLGWAGTVVMQDDVTTLYDETDINCMIWAPDEGQLMPNGGIYTRAWYRANVCSGYQHQDDISSSGEWGRRKVRWIIESALEQADATHDFSQYDGRNGGARDNRINTKELLIVIVMAVPREDSDRSTFFPAAKQLYSGINRNGGCYMADGVRLCGDVIIVDDGVNLATLAHEIMHSIDNGSPDKDIYGGGQSYQMSLKSSTAGSTFNDQASYSLDPWHRMRLGWLEPNIQPLDEQVPPASTTLPKDGQLPVMFMSPERRSREFFLAEHRLQSMYHTTHLANTQGIHVWYVNTIGNGANVQPAEFPAETNWACGARNRRWDIEVDPLTNQPVMPADGVTGASLWTIGFEDSSLASPQCFRNRRGGWWTPLTKSRGTKELFWYPSNPRFGELIPASTPSGLMLTAGELRDDGIDLEWNAGNLPYRPLITTWATDRDNWVINGDFGLPEERRVWLGSPDGEEQVLEVVPGSWTAKQIKVRSVPLTQEGLYYIQCENTELGELGNKLFRRAVY